MRTKANPYYEPPPPGWPPGGQWPYRIALVVLAAYPVIEGLWPVAIVYVLAWLLAQRFLLPEVRRVQQERQNR